MIFSLKSTYTSIAILSLICLHLIQLGLHEESKVDNTSKRFVLAKRKRKSRRFCYKKKILIYEAFMKSLEVMQIIHNARLMTKDILKVWSIVDIDIVLVLKFILV